MEKFNYTKREAVCLVTEIAADLRFVANLIEAKMKIELCWIPNNGAEAEAKDSVLCILEPLLKIATSVEEE